MTPVTKHSYSACLFNAISSLLIVAFVLLISAQASASQSGELNEEYLLKKIEGAKQRLEQTQESVAEKRSKLATQITELEQQVSHLRSKTAAARRSKDEQTLSLQTLEQRLEQWQQQQDHQQNAITRLLQQSGLSYQEISDLSQSDKLNLLQQQVDKLLEAVEPNWHESKAIMPDGRQLERPILALGPVRLVAADKTDKAVTGLGSPSKAGVELEYAYSGSESKELQKLRHSGSAQITFDPTLGKAQQNQSADKTQWQYLNEGGLWIIPIVIAALVSLIMAVTKAVQLYRVPAIDERVKHPMQQQLQRTIDSHLELDAKEDKLVAQIEWMRFKLHKGLTVITVIATIAPLLGLLGTVSGMITTFNMMATYGTSEPQVVSGGIGQALITTELGLVVAIPSLILSAVLTRKAKNDSEKLQQYAVEALEQHKKEQAGA